MTLPGSPRAATAAPSQLSFDGASRGTFPETRGQAAASATRPRDGMGRDGKGCKGNHLPAAVAKRRAEPS